MESMLSLRFNMVRGRFGESPFAGDGGSIMPLIATVMFTLFFALMFLFVITDRRRSHHRRMESIMHDDGTAVSQGSQQEDSRNV